MQGKATPARKRRRGTEGLFVRHSRRCASVSGATCDCSPSYQAQVVIPKKRTGGKQGQKIRRTFSGPGAKAAAHQWRADALSELGRGTLAAPTRMTVGELAEQWVAGAEAEPPTIRRKNGEPFKPSYIRTVADNLRLYVVPDWSTVRLSEISRADVQAWADGLLGRGLSGSKVAGAVGTCGRCCVWRYGATTSPGIRWRRSTYPPRRDDANVQRHRRRLPSCSGRCRSQSDSSTRWRSTAV